MNRYVGLYVVLGDCYQKECQVYKISVSQERVDLWYTWFRIHILEDPGIHQYLHYKPIYMQGQWDKAVTSWPLWKQQLSLKQHFFHVTHYLHQTMHFRPVLSSLPAWMMVFKNQEHGHWPTNDSVALGCALCRPRQRLGLLKTLIKPSPIILDMMAS